MCLEQRSLCSRPCRLREVCQLCANAALRAQPRSPGSALSGSPVPGAPARPSLWEVCAGVVRARARPCPVAAGGTPAPPSCARSLAACVARSCDVRLRAFPALRHVRERHREHGGRAGADQGDDDALPAAFKGVISCRVWQNRLNGIA